MTTCDEPRLAAPAGPLLPFLWASLQRAAGIVRARRNRREAAKLLAWDEHLLRDIGLARSDVRTALAAPFAEDPTLRLEAIVHRRRRNTLAARSGPQDAERRAPPRP